MVSPPAESHKILNMALAIVTKSFAESNGIKKKGYSIRDILLSIPQSLGFVT